MSARSKHFRRLGRATFAQRHAEVGVPSTPAARLELLTELVRGGKLSPGDMAKAREMLDVRAKVGTVEMPDLPEPGPEAA